MARKRIHQDRVLTNQEKMKRFQDKACAIDDQMHELFQAVDWVRRHKCESNMVDWINTYCKGILIDDSPPPMGEQILDSMYHAIDAHTNYCILMGRGNGKSSYAECTAWYAMATGKQKYTVIISNNNRSANGMLRDIWKMISEKDTAFAQDYPEICGPYQLANGSIRRRQLYRGVSTELGKTATDILLPRLQTENGEYPTSGSIITSRSISSGLRGMKKGTLRPGLVILDDLQDAEIANNPESVKKIMDVIKKDIMPLAGKERLSIIQTATPIVPDDLVEQIQQDPYWQTTLFPSIISYPTHKALWDEYFQIYDAELVDGLDHNESLEFYKKNYDQMNEGSDVFNPTRFSKKDGHISAIQKLLELEHNLGKDVFQAEYQMRPIKQSFVVEVSPSVVSHRLNGLARCQIPEAYRYITYGIDINPAYAISVVGMAWQVDTTGIVFYHRKFKIKLDQKLTDASYNNKLHNELTKVCDTIKGLNIKPNAIAIDCGGRQWDAVTLFCKHYKGLPVCAFAGRSATQFANYQYSKSRLKDAIGHTVLCGDNDERARSGSGTRYVFFDADWTKHAIQQGINTVVGDVGSISLYGDDSGEHIDFCIEVTNEKIKSITHKTDGRDLYNWQSKEPHDDLDCCAMNRACLSQLGVTTARLTTLSAREKALTIRQRFRGKVKIV